MNNSMLEVKEELYKDNNISILYDNDPISPREWDNICIIHIGHRSYSFGDKSYNDYESIEEARKEARNNGDIVLPLYMYDHSGITISLTPFSCRWDSGQVGFVQIPREKMLKEFNKKIFTKKLKEKALEIAKREVETLDSYICGNVYGFVINEYEDSCWGYYSIEDALDEAKSIIDYNIKNS